MFSAKSKTAPEPKKEEADWRKWIAPAREETLARSAENLKKFIRAHEDDKARFKLTAVRNGDYLTVSVNRPHADAHIQSLNERDEKYPDMVGRWGSELDNGKETQSLNLSATRTVILKKGAAPGERYKSELHRSNYYFDGEREGKLSAYLPELSSYSRFRDLTPPPRDDFRGMTITESGREPDPELVIDGLAEPASDDLVIFTGINMAICVPAELGEAVRDQILAAMASPLQ